MNVEWDINKAISNKKKHGVSFEEATSALMDPLAITFFDESSIKEERNISIGYSFKERLLIVVHTERYEKTIRIISARKATKAERRTYEERI